MANDKIKGYLRVQGVIIKKINLYLKDQSVKFK